MVETQYKALVQNRAYIKGNVTRIINYFERNSDFDIDSLETRKAKLEEAHAAFERVQFEIDQLLINQANNQDIINAQEEEKVQFDDAYYKAANIISKKLRELTNTNNSANRSMNTGNDITTTKRIYHDNNSLLPKIEIRPFDGNPLEWISFRDTFESVVPSSTIIPSVQKFHLLKNSLRGSLTTVVESLSASEENYNVAWELIKSRCNKPRQIVYAHIKSILDLPEITKDSPINIRNLQEKAVMHYHALKAHKEPVETWNSVLVYIITQKLDKNTRRTWEHTLEESDLPTFTDLMNFLSKRSRGDDTETIEILTNKTNNHKPNHRSHQSLNTRNQAFVGTQRIECAYCNAAHFIFQCEKFLHLSPQERCHAARAKRLCMNCLRANHNTSKCLSAACKKCNKKHNTLLHFNNSSAPMNAQEIRSDGSRPNETPKLTCTVLHDSEVLLGTARIKILDKFNREHDCRVLLDGCSQSHFITERLADILNLTKTKIDLPFAGIGQITTRAKFTVKTKIRSRINSFESELEFVALPVITNMLPSKFVNKNIISLPHNVQLADPEFNCPLKIDALIGTTVFYKLLCNGQIKLFNNSDIVLQKTLLGWIVTGEVATQDQSPAIKTCNLITLETQISRFWEMEEVPKKKYLSPDEKTCENLYSETTKRDAAGRYIVKLPFKDKKHNIGRSYETALKRFYSLEQKLSKDTGLKQNYTEFINEYHSLNHMEEITRTDKSDEGYYIPHHAVIKNYNETTKLRVVFDGSSKSSTNTSLNDALLIGPTIQDELIFIIMRFRLKNIVLATDLQKMYRQIKIDQADAKYQKILWRENRNDTIRVFQLTTVTQGTASAPFLAARTLYQLAKDEGGAYPLAAAALQNNCYVDDLLIGVDTVGEALTLKNQLIKLLGIAGFTLHKWTSNNLDIFHDSHDVNSSKKLCLDATDKKILGVHWDPTQDIIKYSINSPPNSNKFTKRSVLSNIAQLFDPLGILGPVIIVNKLIMQELWKLKLDWDESLPLNIRNKWIEFNTQLPILRELTIPRQITLSETSDFELHGFCDSSEQAYGACVYLRSTDNHNNRIVNLICSKSRVAPLKSVSLPRLELCAAHLLSNLINKVADALKIKFSKVYMWSDSTITLHWIRMSPHLLKTFIANRVTDIQSLTYNAKWLHVASSENPADYISRGQNPSDFIKNELWFHGPSWLTKNEEDWKTLQLSTVDIPEQRTKVALSTLEIKTDSRDNDIFIRFSCIIALKRFVALCLRAVKNKGIKEKITGNFTSEELNEAHNRIIMIIQNQYFARDLKTLKENSSLHAKSEIKCLDPFLDTNGIIRVGGRIVNSNLSYSKKHPILLPRNSHLTKLIIKYEHIKGWHSGTQTTLNSIRNKYWPIDGKNAIRHIIHQCVRCSKFSPKFPNYVMGNLPKERVTQSRPFENVGIDYCGPFFIKEKKHRNKTKIKAYVSVFVCFAVKAVHLELVTDLTTESCLEAIKRFVARRGKPKTIFSDNGTNFIGAKNELLKVKSFLLSEENQNTFSKIMAKDDIKWHFTPPRSPHFGGLWEAAVKSFKNHLYRTVGGACFTYEQFNTCIIEIESILNSRPLTPISNDPNDFTALTPSHFLIGDNSQSILEYNIENLPINKLSMWQRIQQVKQHFWTRWHKEYLNELRTRSKWHIGDQTNVKIGTLVSIKEDNLPPMYWSIGRIVELHPGADNIARVETIRTSNGLYKRSIKRLSPLPIKT